MAAPDIVETETPDAQEPMGVEEIRNAAHRLISDARQYDESELSPKRTKATQFYQGKPFGNEEDGRSQVVLTDLRDTVRAILPSLIRVFFGAEDAVEYQPHRADAVEAAAQATEFVNRVVLQQDNPGFLIFHAWFKDALVRNIGVVKWWWEDRPEVHASQAIVAIDQLELLATDPEIGLSTITESGLSVPGNPSYHVEYRHTAQNGRARYACIPPNEFLRSRDARSLKDAAFVAHSCEKTSSELIAMGIPKSTIKQHGGLDHSQQMSAEVQARTGSSATDTAVEWANEKHTYVEAFPYLDVDGDGYAELRKLCCLGPGAYVVNGDGRGEPWDERPFGVLIPDPEPHTLDGQGVGDWTMDLQKWGSSLVRAINDSLANSIFPRTAYVEGQVNVEDILTTKIGAPLRCYQPPAQVLQEFSHEFSGAKALPMLDLIARIKDNRVGPLPARLDPDALQSSTSGAVNATVTAAQEQLEMIARIFAETGVRDLFKGLLKLLNAYQPKERMVRLRGQFVPIDPKSWDAEMDVSINVALGAGLEAEKLATLAEVAADQKEILSTLGPSNPLVTLGQYRNTRAKMLSLRGWKDASQFYNELPLDFQPPPQPPQPDPNLLIAQAEMAKAQGKLEKDKADFEIDKIETMRKMAELQAKVSSRDDELGLRAEEIRNLDDRERDKLDVDIALRAKEMELKYQQAVDTATITAAVERDRAKLDADTKIETAKLGKRVTLSKDKS